MFSEQQSQSPTFLTGGKFEQPKGPIAVSIDEIGTLDDACTFKLGERQIARIN
jgi:hypothetical protein